MHVGAGEGSEPQMCHLTIADLQPGPWRQASAHRGPGKASGVAGVPNVA